MSEPVKPESPASSQSYTHLIADVASSSKNLLLAEVSLLRAELDQLLPRMEKHIHQVLLFSMIGFIGAISFGAFLVIGLGELLHGNYLLSSLIVAVALTLIAAPLSLRFYRKLKNEDLVVGNLAQGITSGAQAIEKKVAQAFHETSGANHVK